MDGTTNSLSSLSKETGEIRDEEIKVLTVSDLNGLIKKSLEGQFALVWLKGEISNFKAHSSGHFYFSLKDDKSQILAVMFRGYNSRLDFKPADGMEVIVRGRVSVYPPRGNYQILIEKMDAVGAGSLQKAYEQLKLKLHQKGLFDPSHKKPLPQLPKKIALITSPTGAAVRDMIQVLGRRYKAAEILIIPSLTQGEGAAQSLIQSVKTLDKMGCDVAIIGRGGGSIEDMWCFNDEALAQAVYDCQTPIVSAVGHEIDFTICDFVCDLRAPTPSAAAELVAKDVNVVLENLIAQQKSLTYFFKTRLSHLRSAVQLKSHKLVDPKKHLQDLRLRCEDQTQKLISYVQSDIAKRKVNLVNTSRHLWLQRRCTQPRREKLNALSERLRPTLERQLNHKKVKFKNSVGLLDSLNPLNILHRGYSVIREEDLKGEVLKDKKNIRLGQTLWVGLAKGSLKARVIEIEEKETWQAQ